MNATAPITARIGNPAQLITALPYLLGFHPRDSLVVVTLRPGAPPAVGLVLRADLPPPGDEDQVVAQLRAPLRTRGTPAVVVAVIGGPPRAPAVLDTLRAALDQDGVTLARTLWAESTGGGGRWSDLDDPGGGGVLPDPATGDLALAAAVAGVVTFADRDHLARLVAPDPDDVLARRAVLLDAAVAAVMEAAVAPDPGVGLQLVRDAIEAAAAAADAAAIAATVRTGAGRLPETDDEVVGLAVALSDPAVRDGSLRWCVGDTAAAAERLWQALTRMTPAPEVAEVASLAAVSAYLRGDGALAVMALERAEQAWPGHNLSTLLRHLVANAVPPERLDRLVRGIVSDTTAGTAADAS
jgi:hypothetical protein